MSGLLLCGGHCQVINKIMSAAALMQFFTVVSLLCDLKSTTAWIPENISDYNRAISSILFSLLLYK